MRSHSSSGITCYDWGGPVAAPPLVLLHGFSDSGWCWAAAVDRWTADFRVLTVDIRGHGLSERFTPYELAAGPQAIMVAVQVAQTLALLLLPPAAVVLGYLSIVLFFWLASNLIAELHGFSSALRVFGAVVAVFVGLVIVMSLVLTAIWGPEVLGNV